ncbi:MAG: hypothetical protein JWN34_5068 [Bryobacterales bacterium]|nr:hypothetical protein [Bryobacterales bacterium]
MHVCLKLLIPDLGVVFGQPGSQFLKLTRGQGLYLALQFFHAAHDWILLCAKRAAVGFGAHFCVAYRRCAQDQLRGLERKTGGFGHSLALRFGFTLPYLWWCAGGGAVR